MKDNILGITITLMFGGFFISIPWAISSYNQHRNTEVTKAIQYGAKPLEVMCAYDNALTSTCNNLLIKELVASVAK